LNIVKIENNKNNIIKKHNDLVSKARYSLNQQSVNYHLAKEPKAS